MCTVAAEPAKDSPAARVSLGSPQLTAHLRDTFALHQNIVDCELLDRDGIHPTAAALPPPHHPSAPLRAPARLPPRLSPRPNPHEVVGDGCKAARGDVGGKKREI